MTEIARRYSSDGRERERESMFHSGSGEDFTGGWHIIVSYIRERETPELSSDEL